MVCCCPTHSTANVARRASLLNEVSREQASLRVDAARHKGPKASASACKAPIGASDVLVSHSHGQSLSLGVVLLGSVPLSSEKSSSNAAKGATTPLRASSTFCLRGASRSLDAVRMASNSKNKPPTTSSDGHESHRWREGVSTQQDAEIAQALHGRLRPFVLDHGRGPARVGRLHGVPSPFEDFAPGPRFLGGYGRSSR